MQQYILRLWHLAGAVGSMGFLALVEGEETRLHTGREPRYDGGGQVGEELSLGRNEFEVGAKIRFISVSFSLPRKIVANTSMLRSHGLQQHQDPGQTSLPTATVQRRQESKCSGGRRALW